MKENIDVIYKTPEGFDLIGYLNIVSKELQEGVAIFNKQDRVVTVFGSARIKSDNKYFKATESVGALLAKLGYSVMTGGGPGVMEAALKGAVENNGNTYGVNIILPHEQRNSTYIKNGYICKHLFTRKVLLTRNVEAYIIMPGGYGTLDELFEVLTLIATNIQNKVPVILYGKEFWSGLVLWIKEALFANNFINKEELDFIQIIDSAEEIKQYL